MIHVVVGTKAQFIKMFPIMRALEARAVPYNLVDLGQHALITQNLLTEFAVKAPHIALAKDRNVSSIAQGMRWVGSLIAKGRKRRLLQEEVFQGQSGICLVHGDTASTIMAVFLAKQAGLKVAHIEAGLRSFDLWEPFPEEAIRVLVMRFSDILFAPSAWAFSNLVRMGLGARCVPLSANTSLESLKYSLSRPAPIDGYTSPFSLVTVHRMENIFSRRRLGMVVDLVEKIASQMNVVFVQHHPTITQLKNLGLQQRLEKIPTLKLLKILSHHQFVHLLARAEYVVTDGGSIQEECSYLGVPCLLLRRRTERMEGVGRNVLVAGQDFEAAERFLNLYQRFRCPPEPPPKRNPSAEIVDYLCGFPKIHKDC